MGMRARALDRHLTIGGDFYEVARAVDATLEAHAARAAANDARAVRFGMVKIGWIRVEPRRHGRKFEPNPEPPLPQQARAQSDDDEVELGMDARLDLDRGSIELESTRERARPEVERLARAGQIRERRTGAARA